MRPPKTRSPLGPLVPPAWVTQPMIRARAMLATVHDRMAPPLAFLVERLGGMAEVRMLAVALELGIPDELANEPRTAAELATATDSDAQALDRMLRFLVSRGFFATADGRYANNANTDVLRRDHPQSVRDWAMFMGAGWHWDMWKHADHAVRTGRPPAEVAFGKEFFDFLDADPEAARIFNGAMACTSRMQAELLLKAYDASWARSICDVGGGTGNVLMRFLDEHPQARGIVFDIESVQAAARANIAERGMDHRCEFTAGDFFSSVPGGFDLYTLLAVVHDWDDDSCVKILGNVRAALGPEARALVVEADVRSRGGEDLTKIFDMEMLVVASGGRERTLGELHALFARAGLRVRRDVMLPNLFHAFELVPA